MIFKKYQKYYNPARVDPCNLMTFAGPNGRKTISVLEYANAPACAVSVVSIGDSHLQRPYSPAGDGKFTKYVTGMFLSQEDLLFMSTVLMALNLPGATGSMKGDRFIFGCRPLTDGEYIAYINLLFLLIKTLRRCCGS